MIFFMGWSDAFARLVRTLNRRKKPQLQFNVWICSVVSSQASRVRNLEEPIESPRQQWKPHEVKWSDNDLILYKLLYDILHYWLHWDDEWVPSNGAWRQVLLRFTQKTEHGRLAVSEFEVFHEICSHTNEVWVVWMMVMWALGRF